MAKRDDALFRGTLLAELGLSQDLRATEDACRAAFAIFDINVGSGSLAGIKTRGLDPAKHDAVVSGCYELFLLLAETTANRASKNTAERQTPSTGPGSSRSGDRARPDNPCLP